jgi:hypothetical protein
MVTTRRIADDSTSVQLGDLNDVVTVFYTHAGLTQNGHN